MRKESVRPEEHEAAMDRLREVLAERRRTLEEWLRQLQAQKFRAERETGAPRCFYCMDERVCAGDENAQIVRIAGALVATPPPEWEALARALQHAGTHKVIVAPHQGCGAMALRQQAEGNTEDLWTFTIRRTRELAEFLRKKGFEVEIHYQVYAQGGAEVVALEPGEAVEATLRRALDEPTSEEHEAFGVVVVLGAIPSEVVRSIPPGMFVVSGAKWGELGSTKKILEQVALAANIAFGRHNVFAKMFSADKPFEIVVLAESAGGAPDFAEEILREIPAALTQSVGEGRISHIRAQLVRLPVARE